MSLNRAYESRKLSFRLIEPLTLPSSHISGRIYPHSHRSRGHTQAAPLLSHARAQLRHRPGEGAGTERPDRRRAQHRRRRQGGEDGGRAAVPLYQL